MFRWEEPDYETRIARLERTIAILVVIVGLMVVSLVVVAWTDHTQAKTEKSLGNVESSLIGIAHAEAQVDRTQDTTLDSQNKTITYLLSKK